MYAKPLPIEDRLKAIAWVRETIFKPWRAGAQGPDAYDCWGLARADQRVLAGRDLPIVNIDPADLRSVVRAIADHPLRAEWEECPMPAHLDLVTMAHHRHESHIGTFLDLDGGGVHHALRQFDRDGKDAPQKPGVTFDSLAQLKVMGFAHFHFMRYRGSST